MLIDELVGDGFRPLRGDARIPDGFAFRERLFSEERAWEVEITAGPSRIVAERPEVLDHRLNLVVRQCIAERRHVTVEPADRPAPMHHGVPIAERLNRVRGTVGEIRQRRIETDHALRRTLSIRSMTRRAVVLENVFAVCVRRQRVCQRCRRRRGILRRAQRNRARNADVSDGRKHNRREAPRQHYFATGTKTYCSSRASSLSSTYFPISRWNCARAVYGRYSLNSRSMRLPTPGISRICSSVAVFRLIGMNSFP